MRIVYLPGFSKKNKEELDTIISFMEHKNFIVYAHEWRHWQNQSQEWDIETEITKIKKELTRNEQYVIVAKSIGTIVAAKILCEDINYPQKIILMGIPLGEDLENKKALFQSAFSNYKGKIFVIQNNKDPYGSSQRVHEALANISYNIIIKESDNHTYSYPQDIYSFVSN